MDNAFQLALNTDPLAESGEEDEDARCDYSELWNDATPQFRKLRCSFPRTSLPITRFESAARPWPNTGGR